MFQQLQKISDSINSHTEPYAKYLHSNTFLSSILIILLVIYASVITPKLPVSVLKAANHPVTQLIMFFLVAYLAYHNVVIALIAAIAVVMTLLAVNKFKIENMTDLSNDELTQNLQKCNAWRCDDSNTILDSTWKGNSPVESTIQPYESNEDQPLSWNVLSEEQKVTVVMSQKNEMEQQIGRPLSDNELKTLCAKMPEIVNTQPSVVSNALSKSKTYASDALTYLSNIPSSIGKAANNLLHSDNQSKSSVEGFQSDDTSSFQSV